MRARYYMKPTFNSSFQDTCLDMLPLQAIGFTFQFLILGYEVNTYRKRSRGGTFNSSFQDTNEVTTDKELYSLNFQFLILGYIFYDDEYVSMINEDFQFLILGYLTCGFSGVRQRGQLSIPHFRIQAPHRGPGRDSGGTFNSSFQDTYFERWLQQEAENFQFLILGYPAEFQGIIATNQAFNSSFQDTWAITSNDYPVAFRFQFLILGYTTTNSSFLLHYSLSIPHFRILNQL